MTTDKPKWWQSWIFYAIVGLSMMLGPYVGGYLWMGKYSAGYFGTSSRSRGVRMPCHFRKFHNDTLARTFAPLGWAEAQIRGEIVDIYSPSNVHIHKPRW